MVDQPPKLTVAICGSGIAGLTFAIALSQASDDINIVIYEAAHELTEIGAGVAMWRRPWQVMETLGLKEDLSHIVLSPLDDRPQIAFEMRKSDRPPGITFHDLQMPMGNLGFHRADFQKALGKHLGPKVQSYFGKRLVSYQQDRPSPNSNAVTPIKLTFADGSTAECDLLVGADGLHSATRHTLLKDVASDEEKKGNKEKAQALRDLVDPVWSGWIAYRALVPKEELKKHNPDHNVLKVAHNYVGKNKHMIVFPIEHDGSILVNFVGICFFPGKEGTIYQDKTIGTAEKELLELYEGWEDETQQILKCIKQPSKWVINVLKPLPTSVHGRVALIGDAAHAMTPHQGTGAGQAIEDAYVLAAVLGQHQATGRDRSSLDIALRAYEAVRLPSAIDVQRRSRLNGRLFDFLDVSDSDNLTMDDLKSIAEKVTRNWEWAWSTTVEDDKLRALQILKDKLA